MMYVARTISILRDQRVTIEKEAVDRAMLCEENEAETMMLNTETSLDLTSRVDFERSKHFARFEKIGGRKKKA